MSPKSLPQLAQKYETTNKLSSLLSTEDIKIFDLFGFQPTLSFILSNEFILHDRRTRPRNAANRTKLSHSSSKVHILTDSSRKQCNVLCSSTRTERQTSISRLSQILVHTCDSRLRLNLAFLSMQPYLFKQQDEGVRMVSELTLTAPHWLRNNTLLWNHAIWGNASCEVHHRSMSITCILPTTQLLFTLFYTTCTADTNPACSTRNRYATTMTHQRVSASTCRYCWSPIDVPYVIDTVITSIGILHRSHLQHGTPPSLRLQWWH